MDRPEIDVLPDETQPKDFWLHLAGRRVGPFPLPRRTATTLREWLLRSWKEIEQAALNRLLQPDERGGRWWTLTDHLCKACSGRILRCVRGQGMSPGGNPLYRCASCGAHAWGMGPPHAEICWCAFRHRGQADPGYRCLPYSILRDHPTYAAAFEAAGCSPKTTQDVGIAAVSVLRDLQRAESTT